MKYTWGARGNGKKPEAFCLAKPRRSRRGFALTNDGVFTYTYSAAGRMVARFGRQKRVAESITSTLVYTYNAAGLRVAQSVIGFGEPAGDETTFAWDWASGVPEMMAQSPNPQSPNHQSLYLVGHDTLG
mgnify:CR=1 FL=1